MHIRFIKHLEKCVGEKKTKNRSVKCIGKQNKVAHQWMVGWLGVSEDPIRWVYPEKIVGCDIQVVISV